MPLKSLSFIFASCLMVSAAHASSMVVSTDTLVASSMRASEASSDASSSLADQKIVRAAREDAASFVATAGVIRGAHLEAALLHIRQQAPHLAAKNDLELAQAILNR